MESKLGIHLCYSRDEKNVMPAGVFKLSDVCPKLPQKKKVKCIVRGEYIAMIEMLSDNVELEGRWALA